MKRLISYGCIVSVRSVLIERLHVSDHEARFYLYRADNLHREGKLVTALLPLFRLVRHVLWPVSHLKVEILREHCVSQKVP